MSPNQQTKLLPKITKNKISRLSNLKLKQMKGDRKELYKKPFKVIQ
jgi:hypothetical protein